MKNTTSMVSIEDLEALCIGKIKLTIDQNFTKNGSRQEFREHIKYLQSLDQGDLSVKERVLREIQEKGTIYEIQFTPKHWKPSCFCLGVRLTDSNLQSLLERAIRNSTAVADTATANENDK